MTESNVNNTNTIPTESSSPFSTTSNPLPTSILPDCNVIDCPLNTPFPEPTTTTIPETAEIPISTISTIYNSTDSSSVLAYDEENGCIVGNNNNTNRKTMYYEDYR
ncbi:8754_t:CDS:2 [Rhizophagus irregularis]|nr:8754_t:CDS:2 [Rhizophagus irregularis]